MIIHQFNGIVAIRYGLEEAIVAEQIYLAMDRQDFYRSKVRENHSFWRIPFEDLKMHMGYMKPQKIRRAIKSLMEQGFLLVDYLSDDKKDRTPWYAFTSDFLNVFRRR